jgi:hypothetical protein
MIVTLVAPFFFFLLLARTPLVVDGALLFAGAFRYLLATVDTALSAGFSVLSPSTGESPMLYVEYHSRLVMETPNIPDVLARFGNLWNQPLKEVTTMVVISNNEANGQFDRLLI